MRKLFMSLFQLGGQILSRKSRFNKRNGSAIIIVMFVLGLTMTLSYSMIRMQHSVATVHLNHNLSGSAKRTATSAAMIALKHVKDGTWGGFGTTISGSLSSTESYEITYTAGDSSLTSSDPEWSDNPYRMTITITATGAVKIQGDLQFPKNYPSADKVIGSKLLIVVGDASSLTSQESARQTAFINWGFAVDLITASATQSAYDAKIAANQAAYISEEILPTDVGTKLTNASIGILNEQLNLYDELNISNAGSTISEKWGWVIDNTHYITEGFKIGEHKFTTDNQSQAYLGGNIAAGAQVLIRWAEKSRDGLAVMEAGATDNNGGTFAGRRVILPFVGDAFNFTKLVTSVETITQRSIQWASATTQRKKFLSDLATMALSSSTDNRPFNGAISIDESTQTDSEVIERLDNWLQLSVSNVPTTLPNSDWALPSRISKYQLFEGGPYYKVQYISSSRQTSDLLADPATNSLGIFVRAGDLGITSGVTVRGTLIVTGKVIMSGTGVPLGPVELSPLDGTTAPIRLPSLVCNDLEIAAAGGCNITGLVAIFERFLAHNSSLDNAVEINGRLVFGTSFTIEEHDSWASVDFASLYKSFAAQSTTSYFPEWFEKTQSLTLSPRVSIQPDSTEITYHWIDPAQGAAVFVPKSGSSNISLEFVRWAH
jgi:hypothetical protein